MKKIVKTMTMVAILSVLVAGMSFAGGGSQPSSGGAAPDAKREIVFWDMQWGPADAYPPTGQALADRFNAENKENIVVKYQSVPWDNWYQVFMTAIGSKAVPDVTASGFPLPILVADMGEALELDQIIEQWKKENSPILTDIEQNLLDLEVLDGHQYGIPWSLDPRQILYRKDYFQKAGIQGTPKTWADFLDACAKLKAAAASGAIPSDVVPFVFPAGGDYNGTQTILTFMFQNDVGVSNPQGTAPNYTDPKVTEVLKFFHEIYVKGYVPEGIASYKYTDAEKLYQSGKAAIYHHGMMDLKDFPEIDANSAIMPPMTGPSGKTPRYYTWVNAMMGFKQTKDPDAARSFIKWMIENNVTLWTKGLVTGIPVRKSFRNDAYFSQAWQKKEVIEKCLPTVVTPVWPASGLYIPWNQLEGEAIPQEGMVTVFTNNEPNYQAIQQQVQAKLQKVFDEYK
jgi:multiple sugar transport system substrate-binding protein